MNNPPAARRSGMPNRMHRRQVFLQIVLPLTLGVGLALAAAVISTLSMSSPTVSKWSHLSLILLILIAGIMGFVILLLLVGIIYALAKLLGITPVYAQLVQNFFFRLSVLVRYYADQSMTPILALKSWWAGLSSIFKK